MHFCDHGAISNLDTLHEALSVEILATLAAIDIIKYMLIKECFKVSWDDNLSQFLKPVKIRFLYLVLFQSKLN